MDRETLRTGEVAAQAGVNVQTLRYYERRGLLRQPERRASGYREYLPDAVQLVRFIKRAQELGFTLTEIEDLLLLRDNQKASCREVRAAAQAKIKDIDQKLQALRSMKRALRVLVNSCTSEASARYCPILEALDNRERQEQRS